ncbi:TonB-dependent receptor plug domain-containing protein [Allorhizobium borbori]|uniref:Vitamin B12 transporter n=1 Tax=Allorhizobium borbori TaxID=485907 RepID=A0A7W6K2Z6_9HYPH|nr:TonB-dependent receptor [Allorhizobium borbori]MBB4104157.1 vitamin B12 transporter [Allorhizobium borbori]
MRKLLFTTSLAAIAASSVPAAAQDAALQNETTLAPIVVVTPLRRESALAGATASVTVIDRETIDKAPTNDVAQLLKSYAGVSVNAYGGLGSSSGVQLRGMSSTQTLILVNGVRTASATLGSSSLANIPLESIERIEIVKGPRSAAYGADAIGGVINIITKQGGACPQGKAICGSITAGVSHPWGGFTAVDVRGQKDDVTFAVGANLLGTRGYDFTLNGLEPDDDGFLRGAMNFALAKKFDWGKIYADGLFSRGRSQFDASWGGNETDSTAFSGKAGVRVDHGDDWTTTVEASQGFDKAENFRDGTAGTEDYITRRTGVLARTEKSLEAGGFDHTFLLGSEYYHESITTNAGAYAETSRDLSAIFAQYSLERDAWHFDSGVRYDYNEQFGDALTYNLGAAYDVNSDLTLRASWGTGFRAPSFNDLYYPFSGNPDLDPERSRTAEVGFTWAPGVDTRFEASLYRTWLKDGIAWAPDPADPSGFTWRPYNITDARVSGLEITGSHALNDRLTVNGGIDWRDPRDESTGKYIAHRERFKANAGFTFAANEALSFGVNALYGSGAYSDAANTTRLDSYITLDVTAAYKLDEQSSFKLAAENLFDKEYSTQAGYRAPGRTVTLSFTRQF